MDIGTSDRFRSPARKCLSHMESKTRSRARYPGMPLVSPVVFPLFAIVQTPSGPKCACGNDGCSRVGKHPSVAWGALQEGDSVPRPDPGAGIGIKTGARPKGSGVIVVDLDSEAAAEAFEELGGSDDTYEVTTPRGWHLYFEAPGFPVRNSVSELGPGIDIRGDGGFVVAPGSPHREGKYGDGTEHPPAPLPAWLRSWLEARRLPEVPTQEYAGDVSDSVEREYRKDLYRKYLETAPACVSGQGGDGQLFKVVQYGAYDLALPTDDVLSLIREIYDPRCEPPWGDELDSRVSHKANSAKTSSTRTRNEPPPASVGDFFAPTSTPASFATAQAKVMTAYAPTFEKLAAADDDEIFWDNWDQPVEPPTWLVDGLIPVATVGGFVAHGSSLKTWTALSIGAAVAKGAAWLGKYSTRKGKVVFVDYESGDYEIRRRLRMLDGGRIVGLGAWIMPALRIDQEEFWKKLAAIPDLALVVADSLAAGATGVDENLTGAALPLHLAARFAEAKGSAVAFIHHSKKDDTGDARKAVRGSTAIFAGMDWCYAFENVEETTSFRRMHMVSIKPCMGAKPKPVPLELTDAKGLTYWEGDSSGKVAGSAPDADIRARILNYIGQVGIVGSANKIAEAVGARRNRVLTELADLVAMGEVQKLSAKGQFRLDGPDVRRRRIIDTVRTSPYLATPAAIAKAATVPTADVDAAILEGVICKSQEGLYLVRA